MKNNHFCKALLDDICEEQICKPDVPGYFYE